MATIIDSFSEANQNNESELNGYNDANGQSFLSNGGTLDSCKFYLKKFGSPTGNAVAKIYAITGTPGTNAKPSGSALATSDTFDVSTLSTSFQLITFSFSGANKISLDNDTHYFLTLHYEGNSTNGIAIGSNTSSGYSNHNAARLQHSDLTWYSLNTLITFIFYVYKSDSAKTDSFFQLF